ncbi:MAG: ATP-dependent DNA helicase RecQ [Spirochaetales bacterium]|nr:ATP-dependent DNA helicase RecQ [Spirochaetales bacterium]
MSSSVHIYDDPIQSTAREIFGIPYLYPYQRFVLANILEGINQIVIFPTGGGKSVCFQLPLYFMEGITLVVMPLLSLIKDQIRSLNEKRIPCREIKGGQGAGEREEIFRKAGSGELRMLLSTPEVLQNGKVLSELARISIAHIVIDEAHCVSEWGETFRPAYLELQRLLEILDVPRVSAFTATASPRVIENIRKILFRNRPFRTVMSDPDRPNIRYSVHPVLSKNHAVSNIAASCPKPLIIFTRSRKRTELVARLLRDRLDSGEVYFYHAGLTKEERGKIEDWFFQSDKGVLVSTCAYGMGIDKRNIRTVLHADVPLSVEAYLQESGRAGRDGKPSRAILLHSLEDELFAGNISSGTEQARYTAMLGYVSGINRCRRERLLGLLNYNFSGACSGCDVCDGSVQAEPEGLHEIMLFAKSNRRVYSIREARQILSGKPGLECTMKELYKNRFFGVLENWSIDDIDDALQELISRKIIRLPGKGLFKYRLTCAKNRSGGIKYGSA